MTNPNAFRRTVLMGPGLHRHKPVMTRADLDTINAARLKLELAAEKREERRHYNRGHMLSVVKHLPYVRECLKIGMLPYAVPKKVMATVFALRLV